jgi:hypothetical protein
MTSVSLGYCLYCKRNKALFTCQQCKRANYCSASCQSDALPHHIEMCVPRLGDMFQRMVGLHVKDEFMGPYKSSEIFLSHPNRDYLIKGECICCSLSLPDNICVVCGERVRYSGPLKDREFIIKREGHLLSCYRCEECYVKERLICKNSLYDNQCCPYCHIDKVVCFMSLLSLINDSVLPFDIIREICILFNKVKCV